MAIYHFSAQMISRGNGKSSVAASAYRSGEKLTDERLNLTHDYTKKQGVEYTEILTPSNAPEWASDRNRLWNEVEKIEKSKNSQLAREINVALPMELSKEQQIELTKKYVQENFVAKGMVADIALHDNGNGNPHAHIMLTVRPFNEDGTWGAKSKKEYILDENGEKIKQKNDFKSVKIETTAWNKKETLEKWREEWANHTNRALEKAGIEERIDHRTLKEQGIDRVAQIHVGVHANAMEKKGITTEKGTINNDIKEYNERMKALEKEKIVVLEEYREIKSKLEQEKARIQQRYSYLTEKERSAVESSERYIGEPLTLDNAKQSLAKLEGAHSGISLKLAENDFKAKEIKNRINSITADLNALKRAENEFGDLPKNIFGQYKDKNRAEQLKGTIEQLNTNLAKAGYKGDEDIETYKVKIAELEKSTAAAKEKIGKIDVMASTIKEGAKALQNKEVREFYQEYKAHFPQAGYLKYEDMKAIKAANELMGRPVSIEEIRAAYKKCGQRIDNIDKELNGIEENGRRLNNAKQALETIERYKEIADKFDTKVFGKAKFQEEHRTEKWQHDNAVEKLQECKVRDRLDYSQQVTEHELNMKELVPKIHAEKAAASSYFGILKSALNGFENAIKEEKYKQQQNDLERSEEFKQHKKHRSRGMER